MSVQYRLFAADVSYCLEQASEHELDGELLLTSDLGEQVYLYWSSEYRRGAIRVAASSMFHKYVPIVIAMETSLIWREMLGQDLKIETLNDQKTAYQLTALDGQIRYVYAGGDIHAMDLMRVCFNKPDERTAYRSRMNLS